MTATLTFPKRTQAETFAKSWSRFSKRGHVIGAGLNDVVVSLQNVTEDEKQWIDSFISKL